MPSRGAACIPGIAASVCLIIAFTIIGRLISIIPSEEAQVMERESGREGAGSTFISQQSNDTRNTSQQSGGDREGMKGTTLLNPVTSQHISQRNSSISSKGREYKEKDPPYSTTIVTGFWPPNNMTLRKRTDDVYWGWIPHLMGVETPVVVHVDSEDIAARIRTLRGKLPLLTVMTPIPSFFTYKYRSTLIGRRMIDKEVTNRYSVEYSMIMHEKAQLLRRVVQDDPFGTDFFFWLDVGIDRGGILPGKQWPAFLPDSVLHQDQVIVLDVLGRVSAKCIDSLPLETVVKEFGHPQIGIGGGVFGGRGNACLRYAENYYAMLEVFAAATVPLGTDQTVMAAMACRKQVAVFVPPKRARRLWFYLLAKLAMPATAVRRQEGLLKKNSTE